MTSLPFFVIIALAVGGPPCAGVAQPVEQLICNQQVGGSNPSTSSTSPRRPDRSLPRKRESSFPTARLLSKSNPLRWASIWFGRQPNTEEFPSGQRGQTVNLLRFASVVRIHPPPPRRSKLHIACSDFLFKKSERAHSAAPPFQPRPAALGSRLVAAFGGFFAFSETFSAN